MLLYYPQRVNSDMGPTVLLNGELAHRRRVSFDQGLDIPVCTIEEQL